MGRITSNKRYMLGAIFWISLFVVIVTLVVAVVVKVSNRRNISLTPMLARSNHTSFQQKHMEEHYLHPSKNDPLEYYYTELPANNLRILLISNPSTSLSAAAITVRTGFLDDPAHYSGLVHLCEHVVVLRCKKNYATLITKGQVYLNAVTRDTETLYYIQANSGSSVPMLGMFAEMFTNTTFDEESLHSELLAVHEEHYKDLPIDVNKHMQLLRHVSSRDHPFHKFHAGNLDTLNKSDTAEQLKLYYQLRYSANVMNLVFFDNEDIPTMWRNVKNTFSDIPNNHIHESSYMNPPFKDHMGRVVVYKVNTENMASLIWQTPGFETYGRTAVDKFILRYLKYQGEGSILQYLRNQNLACTLTANVLLKTKSILIFIIAITLTEKGVTKVSDVIQIVFHFLSLLQTMSEMEFNDLWEDFIAVGQLKFDYKGEQSISYLVQNISLNMATYSKPIEFLSNPKTYIKNFILVKNILNLFTPTNCLIMIGVNKIPISSVLYTRENFREVNERMEWYQFEVPLPTLDLIEPIYSTPFTIYKIPSLLLLYWSSGRSIELHLPSANNFIFNGPNMIPMVLSQDTPYQVELVNSGMTIWLWPSYIFSHSHLTMQCEIQNMMSAIHTAQSSAMNILYLAMVLNKLSSTLYSANEVGYILAVSNTHNGVEFKLEGFNDVNVMKMFLRTVLDALINRGNLLRKYDEFKLVSDKVEESLMNYKYSTVYNYVIKYLQGILLIRPSWKIETLIDEIKKLTLEKVLEYGESFILRDLDTTCLFYGNTHYISQYVGIIESILDNSSSLNPKTNQFSQKRVILTRGVEYGLALPNPHPMDSSSVVFVTFQMGKVFPENMLDATSSDTLFKYIYLTILSQLMPGECFSELRATQNLGYLIVCNSAIHVNIGSYSVTVQSKRFSPDHMIRSIDTFLQKVYYKMMMASFKVWFMKTVQDLSNNLQHKDGNHFNKDKIWRQIFMKLYHHNLNLQVVELLDKINLRSFKNFYVEHFLNRRRRRKLVIVVYGHGKDTSLNVDCNILFNRISQIQNTLDTACHYNFLGEELKQI